jgi:hypothetical protein
MTPLCYLNPAKSNNVAILSAFAQGSGAECTTTLDLIHGRDAVLYGMAPQTTALWADILRTGNPYWYVDNGYMKSKWHGGDYYRITRNAPQHSGLGESNGARFRALGLRIEPWRTEGKHIVIACQSDLWHQLNCGINAAHYAERIAAELRQYTKRPIATRYKPKWGSVDSATLADDLRTCWAVVTHSSMVALEAVLAGVPAFVLAQCAISPMASADLSEIEAPRRPEDRERWAGVLADNQWSVPEIRNGTAWKALNG